MAHRVIFSPEARYQLDALYDRIADEAGSRTARAFTASIVDHCARFDLFPHRGTQRDDLAPGLRTIGFRRRMTIAFMVGSDTVTIMGVFYGGQDYEAALRDEDER